MKLKLLKLFSLFVLMPMFAVAQEAPLHRVVYLWDVTYSMHGGSFPRSATHTKDVGDPTNPKKVTITGYEEKYDIYDEIMNFLIQHIQNYGDTAEIIVVPFTDGCLTKYEIRERATNEGKRRLASKIRAFYHIDQQYTNIMEPFEYATTLFDGSKYPQAKHQNELYILTDGVHNIEGIPGKKKFYAMLRTWCDKVAKYNVEGFYFLLTDQAIRDSELAKILDSEAETPCIHRVNYYEKSKYTIEGDQLINIKDDYNKPVKLHVEANKPISGTEQVRIKVEPNPYFALDTIVSISSSSSKIELYPHYQPLAVLQGKMPTDNNTSVKLYFAQQNTNDKNTNELTNNNCELRYVNKAQKTLTIEIK